MGRNKVSVFEKMGLVRSIEQPASALAADPDSRIFEEEAELPENIASSMEAPDPSQLLQIAAIYKDAGLAASEQPIFKMEEIMESLPEELSTRQKREITIKLLNTMHLNAEDVKADGQMRMAALMEAGDRYDKEAKGNLMDFKERIRALEAQIDELKEMIAVTEKLNKAETALIGEEVDRINGLLLFISEGSDKS